MNALAVQAVAQLQSSTPAAELEGPVRVSETPSATGPGFGQMVTEGLSRLNGDLLASQVDMQELAVGNVQNLHQIMIRLEETRLNLELMMHVRNRVLEAYQDLMKMQV